MVTEDYRNSITPGSNVTDYIHDHILYKPALTGNMEDGTLK